MQNRCVILHTHFAYATHKCDVIFLSTQEITQQSEKLNSLVIAKKYRIIKKGEYYCIHSYDVHICPTCQQELRVRGSKKRCIIERDGTKKCYNLRQLQCPTCRKIHIEYIDKIIPYKHYSADAIQDALVSSKSSCVAEDSTIRGWKKNGVRIREK